MNGVGWTNVIASKFAPPLGLRNSPKMGIGPFTID